MVPHTSRPTYKSHSPTYVTWSHIRVVPHTSHMVPHASHMVIHESHGPTYESSHIQVTWSHIRVVPHTSHMVPHMSRPTYKSHDVPHMSHMVPHESHTCTLPGLSFHPNLPLVALTSFSSSSSSWRTGQLATVNVQRSHDRLTTSLSSKAGSSSSYLGSC